MNRLRGKKKNQEDSLAPRPSMDYEPSGPFRMFGKKKSQEDEPKKELDLTAALPSTDDFRTSLLMTGLSARFSMLREQDDPKSKLGKASDDSVLYPKRQSRLGVGDFGLGADLHDIAEFDSVKARQFTRVDFYVSSDDTASTKGSIMNRAKPTEGNNLFGGRQKIYKIPVGGAAKGGGMGGKALYDDDVAQSAFQRWRQAEKDLQSFEQDRIREAVETDGQLDYTRRRETSSTTSSGPSAARSSSAATSVISQSASVKEWQASSTTPSSTAQISGLERSVTRTRRLYEQGLSQDLHDQQSSALSRMDTLSRQRPLGSRTPERTPLAPSPTGSGFGDRVQERRTIATKVSAPNLRSYSPPRTGATYAMSPPETHSKFFKPEHKPGFIGNPPLSPPISEAEDYSVLPIQPNDRGKATAMGVFQRPAHQYDESKYAQRQRQLQQGRETPTSQHTELASLNGGVRSHSSSSKRTPSDGMALSTSQKDGSSSALVDKSDDSSVGNRLSGPPVAPQLTIQRPNDQDHPALRKSALPTHLSFASCVLGDEGEGVNPGSKSAIPSDSPTLGPASGLNGMVRQHLRHDSVSSSVSRLVDGETTSPFTETSNKKAGGASARDQDEFARHLADGARRVRERLTTFVETDNDRSTPTTPLSETSKDGHVGRANGLGILRSRTSRSSLLDHEATRSHRSRSLTVQASGASMVGSSAPLRSPSATSSEETAKNRLGSGSGEQARDKHPSVGKDDHAQAGLKAFRQARREFQKMKELEAQQRHQKPTGAAEGTSSQQTNSHVGCASPTMVGRRPQEESRNSSRSRAGFHATTDSRERSGSETSNGASVFGRGVRLRNGSTTHDDQASHLVRRSPRGMGGSAGFPGADAGATVFSSGMSPSHSTGAIEASGRRMGSKRDAADAKTAASTAGRPTWPASSDIGRSRQEIAPL